MKCWLARWRDTKVFHSFPLKWGAQAVGTPHQENKLPLRCLHRHSRCIGDRCPAHRACRHGRGKNCDTKQDIEWERPSKYIYTYILYIYILYYIYIYILCIIYIISANNTWKRAGRALSLQAWNWLDCNLSSSNFVAMDPNAQMPGGFIFVLCTLGLVVE